MATYLAGMAMFTTEEASILIIRWPRVLVVILVVTFIRSKIRSFLLTVIPLPIPVMAVMLLVLMFESVSVKFSTVVHFRGMTSRCFRS